MLAADGRCHWSPHRTSTPFAEFDRRVEHVLKVQRRELGASHRDVGITLTMMAMRHLADRNSVEVQKLLVQAGLVFVQQDGGQPLARAIVEYQQASISRLARTLDVAERHYRSAIEGFEQVLGRNHIITKGIKMDLAGMYHQSGRAIEFERTCREVMQSYGGLQ